MRASIPAGRTGQAEEFPYCMTDFFRKTSASVSRCPHQIINNRVPACCSPLFLFYPYCSIPTVSANYLPHIAHWHFVLPILPCNSPAAASSGSLHPLPFTESRHLYYASTRPYCPKYARRLYRVILREQVPSGVPEWKNVLRQNKRRKSWGGELFAIFAHT